MKTVFEQGWWWPEGTSSGAIHCHLTRVASLKTAVAMLPEGRRRVCVQAGGSHGMWPKMLSQFFRQVYTFEPDAISFDALCQNCREENIVKVQAALGAVCGTAVLRHRSDSSHYILDPAGKGLDKGSPVLVASVDAFLLSPVDALMLDVEGYEYFALAGASRTIRLERPLVLFEFLPKKFVRDAHLLVLGKGYRLVTEVGHDRIYVPEEWPNAW